MSIRDYNTIRTISIHALREEGDRSPTGTTTTRILFLSTPSARRATRTNFLLVRPCKISIHALREEGDRGHCLR